MSKKEISPREQFKKKLEKLCSCRNTHDVWNDLMTACACAISNSFDAEHFEMREKEFMEAEKRLGGQEDAAELFALLMEEIARNPKQDLLGSLYTEYGLIKEIKGQFFTPYHVANLMAKITATSRKNNSSGYETVTDIACGSGVMLVAAFNACSEQGGNPKEDLFFVGQDLDSVAAKMCYIQLSLLGAAGYVCVSNSLTNPITGIDVLLPIEQPGQDIWYTPAYNSGIWVSRRKKIIDAMNCITA